MPGLPVGIIKAFQVARFQMVQAQSNDFSKIAFECFNQAVRCLEDTELDEAVARLRAGFFENLYIAPLLLGQKVEKQPIWHPGPDAEPDAAAEYVSLFRHNWSDTRYGLKFLRFVWTDPLVRNELRSYMNLCKSLRQARDSRQESDLVKERSRFTSMNRIKRTQSEILKRITSSDLDMPTSPPFLGLVMLASRDPSASVDFYRNLFEVEPVRTSQVSGGYAEFELSGIHIGIHGYNHHGQGDPYELGPPPSSFGWGAFFVIRVSGFDRYYENAVRTGIEIVDCDLESQGQRFFVVKDPSGYVLEITEEELRGVLHT